MHLSLLLMAIGLAVLIRWYWRPCSHHWGTQWQVAMTFFLAPPLLLLTTALVVVIMGTQGTMIGLPVGVMGFLLGVGLLLSMVGWLPWLIWRGQRAIAQVNQHPQFQAHSITGSITGRRLDTPQLYAAQIGFWQPELVVSRGIFEQLTPEQVDAILHHEQAHAHFRDTFWFFWLGWMRHCTAWMPHTELLWQELLLLRELRADRWATQFVDPLVLASTLLRVVQSPLNLDLPYESAVGATTSLNRLEARIDALLCPASSRADQHSTLLWLYPGIIAFPLLMLLLHHP